MKERIQWRVRLSHMSVKQISVKEMTFNRILSLYDIFDHSNGTYFVLVVYKSVSNYTIKGFSELLSSFLNS